MSAAFESKFNDHPAVKEIKTKMSQMSRKLNTIEMMTAAEGDARSQMHQELSGEKQPFAFSKNVLSRAQLNELFST